MPTRYLKCSGMQNILNGFLRYRTKLRGELLKQFEYVGSSPHPQSIIFTCVDSRILASRITQANPGDIFMSRNPGSLIPNYSNLDPKIPRTEEAALELAYRFNNIDTIVVCGHSDCKAMNLVYENRHEAGKKVDCVKKGDSVLKTWLMLNAGPSIAKYSQLEKDFKKPLSFEISANHKIQAYIDPDNQFEPNDKFSMVNTLTQLENLKTYSFLREALDKKEVGVFALWLDIYTGDVYVFNEKEKSYLVLNDESYKSLLKVSN